MYNFQWLTFPENVFYLYENYLRLELSYRLMLYIVPLHIEKSDYLVHRKALKKHIFLR